MNTLSIESSLTSRYQTTVPKTIRDILGLRKNDKIRYSIDSFGRVTISRANQADSEEDLEEKEDPVVEKFLSFLEQDMLNHPESIGEIPSDLVKRAQDLIFGVEFDLEEMLEEILEDDDE